MTVFAEPYTDQPHRAGPEPAPRERVLLVRPPDFANPPSGSRVLAVGVIWAVVILGAIALVVYGMGPLFEQRDQRVLLAQYRGDINRAANEAGTLEGASLPVKAPDLGDPVGILEISSIHLQHVVVEGVAASQTQKGPGHVPGTSGLGEAGNSTVIGRVGTYGGPFTDIDKLKDGDAIIVTTTEGVSVYNVESVRARTILKPGDAPPEDPADGSDGGAQPTGTAQPAADPGVSTTATTAATAGATPGTTAVPAAPASGPVAVDTLYGRTPDDRLTLVTSRTGSPLNSSEATVVVAKRQGDPFQATPQGGRTDSQNGLGGEAGTQSALALVLLGYGLVVTTAVLLYRRSSPLIAYVLTTAPLIAATILVAETTVRLLPAWI